LMVAQVVRFWPDYQEAWSRAKSGEIGELKLAVFRRRCGAPAWAAWQKDFSKSGGGVFDLLIHDFDYCVYTLGIPHSVKASGSENPELGIDWVEAELDYPGGPAVFVSGGWQPRGNRFSMEFTLSGSKGSLAFNSDAGRLIQTDGSGNLTEHHFEEGDGFRAELEAFSRACAGEDWPGTGVRSSANAVSLALAALESRRRGGEKVGLA